MTTPQKYLTAMAAGAAGVVVMMAVLPGGAPALALVASAALVGGSVVYASQHIGGIINNRNRRYPRRDMLRNDENRVNAVRPQGERRIDPT
jgi:membrane protein implicated in regulation of membrane protease activity